MKLILLIGCALCLGIGMGGSEAEAKRVSGDNPVKRARITDYVEDEPEPTHEIREGSPSRIRDIPSPSLGRSFADETPQIAARRKVYADVSRLVLLWFNSAEPLEKEKVLDSIKNVKKDYQDLLNSLRFETELLSNPYDTLPGSDDDVYDIVLNELDDWWGRQLSQDERLEQVYGFLGKTPPPGESSSEESPSEGNPPEESPSREIPLEESLPRRT